MTTGTEFSHALEGVKWSKAPVLRQARVTAISGSTISVDLGLGSIPRVARLSTYDPTLGDSVWVLINGPDLLALGTATGVSGTGTASTTVIHPTDTPDDADIIQDALDNYRVVMLGGGRWWMTKSVMVRSRQALLGLVEPSERRGDFATGALLTAADGVNFGDNGVIQTEGWDQVAWPNTGIAWHWGRLERLTINCNKDNGAIARGITMRNVSDESSVRRCNVWNSSRTGYYVRGDHAPLVIENCTAWHCDEYGLWGTSGIFYLELFGGDGNTPALGRFDGSARIHWEMKHEWKKSLTDSAVILGGTNTGAGRTRLFLTGSSNPLASSPAGQGFGGGALVKIVDTARPSIFITGMHAPGYDFIVDDQVQGYQLPMKSNNIPGTVHYSSDVTDAFVAHTPDIQLQGIPVVKPHSSGGTTARQVWDTGKTSYNAELAVRWQTSPLIQWLLNTKPYLEVDTTEAGVVRLMANGIESLRVTKDQGVLAKTQYGGKPALEVEGKSDQWENLVEVRRAGDASPRFSVSAFGTARVNGEQLTTVSASSKYVQSRGQNLVTNGFCLLGDLTNFGAFTGVDPNIRYAGGPSFYMTSGSATVTNGEAIPVDPSRSYRMSYAIRAGGSEGQKHYGMIGCYDADDLIINPQHVQPRANTKTTLAQALNPGDTYIYLTSSANWLDGATSHERAIAMYPYTNAQGFTYPTWHYTQLVYQAWGQGAIDHANNRILLSAPWAGPAYAVGTDVSNNPSGATYNYIAGVNVVTPTAWTVYEGGISGLATPETVGPASQFRTATAFVRVGWLLNRDVVSATTRVDAIIFELDFVPGTGGIVTGDLDIRDSTKGVILTDRSTGTRYRLFVNNGLLSVEAI